MQVDELKRRIESKSIDKGFLIFKYSDCTFLPNQYCKEISNIRNLPIEYLESFESIVRQSSIFITEGNYLDIVKLDSLSDDEIDLISKNLNKLNDCIIVVKNLPKSSTLLGDFIVEFPALESWHLQDYAYSICEGCDTADLDFLLKLCKNNPFLLDSELSKISIFSDVERKYKFKMFLQDNMWAHLDEKSVFDFTTALLSRDIKTVTDILKVLQYCDIEPLGVVTILYNNVKKMLIVRTTKNPDESNTGLRKNQIYAIRKSSERYSIEQLCKLFDMLGSIDLMLKKGELPADMILMYIICRVLSV